ncbi:uncharacterized protein LOC133175780 [Saccostrea echinata]|uniref:uncharacterized protein LOC133175780 n=1 Tax=Saccostrea echinata TaxID=191078 RepID=UPI002A816200|nr:uncharacterized protein LOC133175780 [Saccostrea echinata]
MDSRSHPSKRKEPSTQVPQQGEPVLDDSSVCKKARFSASVEEVIQSDQVHNTPSCSNDEHYLTERVINHERNVDSSDIESDDSADTSVESLHGNQVLLFADIDISTNFHQNPRRSIENDIFDTPTSLRHAIGQNANTTPQRTLNRDRNTYNLQKWQSKHIAKSIVDNAINMTLEEMGVSPETEADTFKREKTEIETFGISHAIQSQGLSPQTDNPLIPSSSSTGFSSLGEGTIPRSDRQFSSDPQPIVIQVNERDSTLEDSALQNTDQSSLINQAVTMAICSQGLIMKNS